MRRTIALCTIALTLLGTALPASADGFRHGHKHGFGHGHAGRIHKNHGHGDGAALFAGGLLLGALIGHLATQPRTVYAVPPPAVPSADCRPITGTGYVNGRLARFSGTGCYDAYGRLYAVPGSERFLGYIQ